MEELGIVDDQLVKEFDKLPADFWDFKNEDTKELTHSIHNYPAVMVYPISRNIISIVKKYQNIESLLDPFMGSGTVLLEGILANIEKVYENDLNPLAHRISKAKTTLIGDEIVQYRDKLVFDLEKEYEKYDKILNMVTGYVDEAGYDITAKVLDKGNWGENAPGILNEYLVKMNCEIKIPNIKNLGFWFVPKCILELQIIKSIIAEIDNDDIKDYFMLCFSETTRLASNRRNGEFKMYRMTPEKVKKYNPNVKKIFLQILDANVEKMNSFRNRVGYKNNSIVSLSLDDATKLVSIPENSIDLVITSPPYGDSRTTVAYGQFSRVSLQWCDYEKLSYKEIIDIDKKLMGGTSYKKGFSYDLPSEVLKKALDEILEDDNNLERAGDVYSFYRDLSQVLDTVTKKCRKNSYQFWVVGNRTVKHVKLPTDEILVELGKTKGLKHITTLGRTISNKVMPSENSPTNEAGKKVKTMNKELIVIFRKET